MTTLSRAIISSSEIERLMRRFVWLATLLDADKPDPLVLDEMRSVRAQIDDVLRRRDDALRQRKRRAK
jgi:hypothetical protein